MNNNTIALIAILLVVGFIVFYKLTSKGHTKEKFSINEMTDKDIMPMYKSVQPKDLVEYYGGIDNLTKVLVQHDIPINLLSDPKQYPKIATYLNLKNVSKA